MKHCPNSVPTTVLEIQHYFGLEKPFRSKLRKDVGRKDVKPIFYPLHWMHFQLPLFKGEAKKASLAKVVSYFKGEAKKA